MAQAMDVHNETSPWSEPLLVEITTPALAINISRGFGIGISAEITILDTIPEETITWSILLDGKFILLPPKGEKTGSFPTPPEGATERISTLALGLGRFEVTVSALGISETAEGLIIGFFTIIE
jgi:hypothetical protein